MKGRPGLVPCNRLVDICYVNTHLKHLCVLLNGSQKQGKWDDIIDAFQFAFYNFVKSNIKCLFGCFKS